MDKGKLSNSANLLRLSTLGLNFVGCTFGGVLIGWLLNKYLHLGEWVILVGLLFGIITSYFILIEDLKALNQDQRKPPAP
jgi:F0F1-type ATP synthase assembly protein I